jgi:hypothetical protein
MVVQVVAQVQVVLDNLERAAAGMVFLHLALLSKDIQVEQILLKMVMVLPGVVAVLEVQDHLIHLVRMRGMLELHPATQAPVAKEEQLLW